MLSNLIDELNSRYPRWHEFLHQLEPRRQLVLNRRAEGITLKAIARELEVTPERVRQLEASAYRKMQRIISKEVRDG